MDFHSGLFCLLIWLIHCFYLSLRIILWTFLTNNDKLVMKRLFTLLILITALCGCNTSEDPENLIPEIPRDIVPQIAELDYISTSADNIERINCVEDSFKGVKLQCYLLFEPESLRARVIEYHNNMVSLHLSYDDQDDPVIIPATPGTAEEWMGSMYVEFACDNLRKELYDGKVKAYGSVVISDSVSEISTKSFEIGVQRIAPQSNQIWYYTNDGQSINLQQGNGPEIISVSSPIYGKYVVTFAQDVKRIYKSYFRNSATLTQVTMPECVTQIDDGAFSSCLALHTINLPSGITSLNQDMFQATQLKNIYINDLAAYCNIDFTGPIISTEDAKGGVLYIGGNKVSDITIPESVTQLDDFCFSFSNVKSITLHNNIVKIGNCTFEKSGIESLVMPNSITSIGGMLFNACCDLKSVTLSNGIDTIPMSTFNGCTSLVEVVIPEGVKKIERSAFYYCSALTELVIPDSVEIIEDHVFSGCSSLESVIFGAGVKSIGDAPFLRCEAVREITLRAVTPPTLLVDLFRDSEHVVSDVTIYVPMESVEKYKTSESWSKYADLIVGY